MITNGKCIVRFLLNIEFYEKPKYVIKQYYKENYFTFFYYHDLVYCHASNKFILEFKQFISISYRLHFLKSILNKKRTRIQTTFYFDKNNEKPLKYKTVSTIMELSLTTFFFIHDQPQEDCFNAFSDICFYKKKRKIVFRYI